MGSLQKDLVLLTGGSGFIASHILDQLLAKGFSVVLTVRSTSKGQAILDSLDPANRPDVAFYIVEDVAKEGAFDQVLRSNPLTRHVVHTASPCTFTVTDPVKDLLEPAIRGATGLLASVGAHGSNVERVVLTSSSAAMLNPLCHERVYDETKWAPWTWEDGIKGPYAYETSKKLSEEAAWAYMATHEPSFSLTVINNTFTFGPVQRHLTHLSQINTSNQRVRDLALGRLTATPSPSPSSPPQQQQQQQQQQQTTLLLPPTRPVFTFVDVRDVARAHVLALTTTPRDKVANRRFYVVGGHFSNRRVAEAIRAAYPALSERIAPGKVGGEDDDLDLDTVYGFDNSRSRRELGMDDEDAFGAGVGAGGYRGLEESIRDTVASLMRLEGWLEG